MRGLSKTERSWVLYDWANSAYTLIITTAIMPLFFNASFEQAGGSSTLSVAYWGYANAIATLALSLLAPFLGTIADYRGYKMKFMKGFMFVGVLFSALLAFIPSNLWAVLLIVYIISAIGYAGSNIFYDAFIVDVTTKERMDKISTLGYGYGYIGSTIPFIVSIGLVILAKSGAIGISVMLAFKISFLISALWWLVFSLPILKNVKQVYGIEPEEQFIRKSVIRLVTTIKNVSHYKAIALFLLAYFFYIDGVSTIIKMSTSYGASLGIDSTMLIVILLVTQIVAFPFAVLFGYLSQQFGNRRMLFVGIGIYTIICIYGYFLKTALDFWVLAMMVAVAQGGIQALSRSYFAQIIPKERSNEFFGFYNIFGNFSAFMGPLLVAVVTQVTGEAKNGVLSVVVLFAIGGLILFFVPKDVPVEKSANLHM